MPTVCGIVYCRVRRPDYLQLEAAGPRRELSRALAYWAGYNAFGHGGACGTPPQIFSRRPSAWLVASPRRAREGMSGCRQSTRQ